MSIHRPALYMAGIISTTLLATSLTTTSCGTEEREDTRLSEQDVVGYEIAVYTEYESKKAQLKLLQDDQASDPDATQLQEEIDKIESSRNFEPVKFAVTRIKHAFKNYEESSYSADNYSSETNFFKAFSEFKKSCYLYIHVKYQRDKYRKGSKRLFYYLLVEARAIGTENSFRNRNIEYQPAWRIREDGGWREPNFDDFRRRDVEGTNLGKDYRSSTKDFQNAVKNLLYSSEVRRNCGSS